MRWVVVSDSLCMLRFLVQLHSTIQITLSKQNIRLIPKCDRETIEITQLPTNKRSEFVGNWAMSRV
jgi:hypothetical protein